MKLVALDVGEKRIGVATADSSVKIAVPRGIVEVDGDELMQIAGIMRDEGAKHLIVGLPRNASGEETAQSRAVRAFVASLQEYFMKQKLERPLVKFQDESLTSVVAEERLSKKKRKKRRQKTDIDSEAAAIILQDFLNSFGGAQSFPAEAKKKSVIKEKVKSKSKVKRRLLKILAVIVGLMVVATVLAVAWYTEMLKPVIREELCQGEEPSEKCESLSFVVVENESTSAIVDRLESSGLIRSALAFKIYLRLNSAGAVMRVGTYSLTNYMSVTEIVGELKKGSAAETFRITFLPGGTVEDAKKRLAKIGYTEDEIATGFAADFGHPVLEGRTSKSLEGYIFGETYEFYTTATVEDVLQRTFDELYKVVQENDLVTKYAERGLSLYEGITLASIIQREAHTPDMPQVAQVFLLRLKRGMALGSCAVIEYRAGQLGMELKPSVYENKDVLGCPWSSRHCTGLPPNPISNPGKAALMSVAEPAEGSYLYFLTDDEGKMRYAYDEKGHQSNINNYCRVRCF